MEEESEEGEWQRDRKREGATEGGQRETEGEGESRVRRDERRENE